MRFILSILVIIHSGASYSFSLFERSAQEEFQYKKKVNQEKFQNFYERYFEIERLDAERRKGEEDVRRARLERMKTEEQKRKDFVAQRKAKPPLDPSEWETELRVKMRNRELDRQDYVRRRDELNNLLNTIGRIPEEDEYDLELDHAEE